MAPSMGPYLLNRDPKTWALFCRFVMVLDQRIYFLISNGSGCTLRVVPFVLGRFHFVLVRFQASPSQEYDLSI